MSRRPHKKSRAGCRDCKRRHIRCDQQRPACSHCFSAEVQCSFLEESSLLPPDLHIHEISSGSSQHVSRAPSPRHGSPLASPDDGDDAYSVNLNHLELFQNLSNPAFTGPINGLPDNLPLEIYMSSAMKTPYLMHMALATSALHLSTTCDSNSRPFYQDQAAGLQTRALSIFNKAHTVLTPAPDNAVEMFLFTSLLSVYLLCDPLLNHGSDFGGFLRRFTVALEICSGLTAVVDQTKHLLENTPLGRPLEVTRLIVQETSPVGSECDALNKLIDDLASDTASYRACAEAALYLRRVFNAQSAISTGPKPQMIQAVIAWPLVCSPVFRQMLVEQKPHALVILANYAVLLHRGRHVWYYGPGGKWLIEQIVDTLDDRWQSWLELPRRAIQE
ncbi:uncharacterized protein AB675_7111 [Cyphellophora attinorum]|uniref:Zn(2)-C6 fungal-type domain-containing protein n=1 Tax=Cyphellophora attinorum TaxID=1664694 RepID=A0A0N1HF32_9EURO|nr:uncharacterized protein AB675_7111 [Phialophora attinorum]KPI43662.1 hypothetical protein AB675_7111 [Phialophora attinorum]